MIDRAKTILERLKTWHGYRAWQRFGDTRGNLLAAGIAYFAFFSLFPAVALAAVVFGFVLQGRPDLLDQVGETLNAMLPGFVKTAENPQGILALSPPETATLSWAGAIATITLVLSGLGWIGSMRDGIRAIFGVSGSPGNAITDKLRDLGVLVLLGVAVLASATLTGVTSGAARWLGERVFGSDGGPAWVLTVIGLLVSWVVDSLIMVILLRVLSGVPLPWADVRRGAIIGGAGMTILKALGSTLVAQATRNPLFGSIVVVVGLLFWLNLIAKLILLSASWTATGIEETLARLEQEHGGSSDPEPAEDPAEPDDRHRLRAGLPPRQAVRQRDADRVGIAAGAVLGASAAVAAGAVGRGLRAIVDAVRRR